MQSAQSCRFESMNIRAFKVIFTREKMKLWNYRSFWEGLPETAKVLLGQEAPEKLSNEILKLMSKSCHVDVSNMLRSLDRLLLTESLESQLKSTDLTLFIQTMPEISAAPYQHEKGQLPVLASAQLTVTQKSLGASAGTGIFLCDAHHLPGTEHCRSAKVFNEINRIYSDFCCGFFQQAGWHPLIAGWASLWEAELEQKSVVLSLYHTERKSKKHQKGTFISLFS